MSTLAIRTLRGDDLPVIRDIWNRALPRDPITIDRFVRGVLCDPDYQAGAAKGDSGFFVATRDGAPVGFLRAVVRHVPNEGLGLEPELGWLPVVAVDPPHQRSGVGTVLMEAALEFFRRHGRRRIWVCGNSGSAPGYVFPGVDVDVYAGGVALLQRHGFEIDREAVAMSREVVNFYPEVFERDLPPAPDLTIETLTPARVDAFFAFLSREFPGDWNTAARARIRAGGMGDVLIARQGVTVVGYCQWEGEHFGPFGVSASLRGRQVGARLFIESVRRIREADGRTVWFNWADPGTARFYARFGLTPTRRFAVMRKDLA